MEYLKFKTKREKILFFINDFKKYEKEEVLFNTFTKGYCYYFALILNTRFGGHILYDEKEGHFVTKIGNYIYDVRGDITNFYKNVSLLNEEEWKNNEEIVYGCIEKYVK